MHFLAFIPGESIDRATALASVGLGHLSENALFSLSPVSGPGGIRGFLVGWSQSVPLVFREDRQTWAPAVQDGGLEPGRYWIGTWNDSPIIPRDLEKPFPVTGRAVRFGDGNDWVIPRAMELPFTIYKGRDGQWAYAPLERYASLMLAVNVWKDRLDGDCVGTPMLDADLADLVLQALMVNYRLTPEIVNHCRLFTSGGGENLARAGAYLLGMEVSDG